jgi:hypothetical protein
MDEIVDVAARMMGATSRIRDALIRRRVSPCRSSKRSAARMEAMRSAIPDMSTRSRTTT